MIKSTVNGLLRISSRLLSHTFSVGLFFVQFFDVFDVEGRRASGGSFEVAGAGSGGGESSFSSAVIDEYSHKILKRLDALIAPPKMTSTTSSSLRPGASRNGNSSSNDFGGFEAFPRTLRPAGLGFSSSSSSSSLSPHAVTPSRPLDSSFTQDGGFGGIVRRCPICGGRRRNETALSVSGFVFCHECISNYLKQHGVCPVTKLPAKTNNLVRLYPDI